MATRGSDIDLPGIPDELWEELTYDERTGKWSALDRLRAATALFVLGTSKKAEEQTGIPHETIRYWKRSCAWWPKVMHHIYRFHDERTAADLRMTIRDAAIQLRDRIENGNFVTKDGAPVLDENGNPLRRPLTAHELAVDGVAIPSQRLAFLMGEAPANNGAADTLRELRKLFQEVGKQAQNVTKDSVLIDQDETD